MNTKQAVAVAVVSLIAFAAPAQEQTNLIHSTTIRVKPGMNQQFEEAGRAFANAARESNAEAFWLTAQSVSGEPVYLVNRIFPNWEAFGNAAPIGLAEVYGEEEAARLGRLAGESIESVHSVFYQGRPDLSYPPDGGEPAVGIINFHIEVNPGRMNDYIEVTRKTVEASSAIEPDAHFFVLLPGFGADAALTTSVIQNWSDLDTNLTPLQQRIIRHFGQEEGQRINALAGQVIAGFEAVVLRSRPELSYTGPAQD